MKKSIIHPISLLCAVPLFFAVLSGCDVSPIGSGTGSGSGSGIGSGSGSGSSAHVHTDGDGNEVCDSCGKSVLAELSFYAVNDLHGKFMDTESQPGVDEFTTYLKDLYEDDKREELLLSSGDMWQGTVESSANKGQLMTEWMNEVGFVSMTLGNHEFDWGSAALTPNSELAEFPFLGINITENGAPASYCRPSTVVERGGMRIGIIGAIGNCLSSISGEFQGGLDFATGSALTDLVKNESARLRNEEGCDFIVYSLHDGGDGFSSSGVNNVDNSDMSYYDTALSNGYVDLVFEAHTHMSYILRDEYGVYHLQGGGENRAVSCAEVTFNTVTKQYSVSPKIVSSAVYGSNSIPNDLFVETVFEKYFGENDPYADIGRNAAKRGSSVIVEKVAELYYQKGIQTWGENYPIVCGGGYLNARSPYYIYAGGVSYADIFSVLPFDNDIVLGKIKGSDLVSFLNRRTDRQHPYHIYTTLEPAQVDSGQDYYIVVDTYTSFYRFNHITEVDRIKGVYARDLLADYIKAGNWS